MISGGGTKIPHAGWYGQKKKNKYPELKKEFHSNKGVKYNTSYNCDLKIKDGFLFTSVENAVKAAIIEYIQNNRVYGLGETVYANEFIIPAYKVDGVENITNLQVGIYGSMTMGDSQEIIDTSLAMFNADWITLNEI